LPSGPRIGDAITAHNGAIVKTTGDGVHAAFATAADAMEAAVGPLREHTAELSVELGWNGLVEEAEQT